MDAFLVGKTCTTTGDPSNTWNVLELSAWLAALWTGPCHLLRNRRNGAQKTINCNMY